MYDIININDNMFTVRPLWWAQLEHYMHFHSFLIDLCITVFVCSYVTLLVPPSTHSLCPFVHLPIHLPIPSQYYLYTNCYSLYIDLFYLFTLFIIHLLNIIFWLFDIFLNLAIYLFNRHIFFIDWLINKLIG